MYRQRAYSIGTVLVSGALMVAIASPVSAQLVVYDAATTARNTVTATVNQILFETQRLQHSKALVAIVAVLGVTVMALAAALVVNRSDAQPGELRA